jgi:hypothetical protein
MLHEIMHVQVVLLEILSVPCGAADIIVARATMETKRGDYLDICKHVI